MPARLDQFATLAGFERIRVGVGDVVDPGK